mmetsp:Transcript_72607/g.100893  ORF Transcript_72607/g.100893 Transcript_72607/m.100893 type:complete len:101 (-) Transcript_72607:55-357(-)
MSADASGNLFSDADAALIRSALDGNATLTSLDLRGNEVSLPRRALKALAACVRPAWRQDAEGDITPRLFAAQGIPSTSEHLSAIQTLTRRNELELRKILA